jgi:hypothetical protein
MVVLTEALIFRWGRLRCGVGFGIDVGVDVGVAVGVGEGSNSNCFFI